MIVPAVLICQHYNDRTQPFCTWAITPLLLHGGDTNFICLHAIKRYPRIVIHLPSAT